MYHYMTLYYNRESTKIKIQYTYASDLCMNYIQLRIIIHVSWSGGLGYRISNCLICTER